MSAHTVRWFDAGKEPQCEPNPAFPTGVDLDPCAGAPGCKVALPYPAKRCGYYVVTCKVCGFQAYIATAGRADDPRSVRLPCKIGASPL